MDYNKLLNEAYSKVEICLDVSTERFKIPKVKGHHLGPRTIVSNFLTIAAHLRRDATHLMKFLSKELASQCEIKNDRLILSRRLSSREINDKIEKYVCKFVLCNNCKKPDTELICENGRLLIRCLACGRSFEIHKI